MNKKKWGLLILAALLLFGYHKLFYKTYSEKVVTKSADCVLAIDVKRVTNSILWQFTTSPGQWKKVSFSSKKTNDISIKDMFELPDYILLFHSKNQPAGLWHTILTIKNKSDFEKGLQQFRCEKTAPDTYLNKSMGFQLIVAEEQVLLSTAATGYNNYSMAIANEIFKSKSYIEPKTLRKVIDASSHIAFHIQPNSFLLEDALVKGNFNKEKIIFSSTLKPREQFHFKENKFGYQSENLLSFGFTQPDSVTYNLVETNVKDGISKALNIKIDSLLMPGNIWYSVNLADIKSRTDSAVSYTYDEDFNPVEQVTVNKVQEPAFNFIADGKQTAVFYQYLKQTNKLEQTDQGELYLPMPLVKAYCNSSGNSQLSITSDNYNKQVPDRELTAIFFLEMLVEKIPANLLNYLPDEIKKLIANIAGIKISAIKSKDNGINLEATIAKKKNDLLLFNF